jgi:acyl carrier protein
MDIAPEANIKERVKDILAEALEVPLADISDDLAIGDLPQWDSMGHMTVISMLEDRFGIEASTDMIAELISLPAILQYLEGQKRG